MNIAPATALPATVVPASAVAVFVTQQPGGGPGGNGGQGEDFGKSSPVGLLLLILFFIAVAFLVRSMTKHLKRIPANFAGAGERSEGETDAASTREEQPEDGEAADSAERAATQRDEVTAEASERSERS